MSITVHEKLLTLSGGRFQTLNKIIATNGLIFLKKKSDDSLFEHLVRTVAGQQLSKQAASTIWRRVIILGESRGQTVYDLCNQKNSEALKSCGLSRFKVKAILGVKDAFVSGVIDPKELAKADYETIINIITSLWGFGRWSADMIALFFFGYPDVWSEDDVALQRGIRFIEEQDGVSQVDILDAVRPYRSYFSLHLWKAIDTGVIN